MSSVYVRDQIKTFLSAGLPSEKFLDLSGVYDVLEDYILDNGLTARDPWVGLEFVGGDESPVTVGSSNTSGKYRETGTVLIHVVDIAKLGASNSILTRAETIRNLLRGKRIGSIIVDSVSAPNFGPGTTLEFEGGYTSAGFIISYEREYNL